MRQLWPSRICRVIFVRSRISFDPRFKLWPRHAPGGVTPSQIVHDHVSDMAVVCFWREIIHAVRLVACMEGYQARTVQFQHETASSGHQQAFVRFLRCLGTRFAGTPLESGYAAPTETRIDDVSVLVKTPFDLMSFDSVMLTGTTPSNVRVSFIWELLAARPTDPICDFL